MGSDLRGVTSADTCFNFALAGVQHSSGLFQTLVCIGVHELRRAGHRASFQPKNILHMVEKFAAADVNALDLYHLAGVCLEKKGYNDSTLIKSLKSGRFGLHCDRPLLWLWRHSSRQKKLSIDYFTSKSKDRVKINWDEIFEDASKPLVVDLGSGLGSSLLNLSTLSNSHDSKIVDSNTCVDSLQMAWSEINYVGADLNQAFVNFGLGIISRSTKRRGRVHFVCLSAEDLLHELQSYPGKLLLIMINFPSPYRLEVGSLAGNSQLPGKHSFMVTKNILRSIAELLAEDSSPNRGDAPEGLFLFQTKCEDVAVHVMNECLSLGTMECVPCKYPMEDVDLEYAKRGKRPKRVEEWLKATPLARAEGIMYSRTSLLPAFGRPETEVQCNYDNILVHRCLFRRRTWHFKDDSKNDETEGKKFAVNAEVDSY